MSRKSTTALILSAIFLISTASLADAKRSRPTAAECDTYAHNYAWDQSRQGQILGATGLGSLGGFAIGSIWAASGIGAAIGAGIGIIGGLIVRSDDAGHIYDVAFQDCMAGRVPR